MQIEIQLATFCEVVNDLANSESTALWAALSISSKFKGS